MSDIRTRKGKKGLRHQVRYANKAAKNGYSYKTFRTHKEATAFRESGKTQQSGHAYHETIRTVADGVDKWLDVCEKEGRGGRDPVTDYTLKTYRYRAEIIKRYPWPKQLTSLERLTLSSFGHGSRQISAAIKPAKCSLIFIRWCWRW